MVSLDDYEAAVEILLGLVAGRFFSRGEPVDAPGHVGRRWLERAAGHLAEKLDRSFRETPRLDTEKQAIAFVKGIALELEKAGAALAVAADQLRAAGRLHPANETYTAHKAARKAAQQWLQVG